MSPSAPIDCKVVVDMSNRCIEEVDKINQCFIKANNSKKIILLKRMRELVNPGTFSLIEPEVKIWKRGKNVTKNEASTHWLPMAHELITSAQDSYS